MANVFKRFFTVAPYLQQDLFLTVPESPIAGAWDYSLEKANWYQSESLKLRPATSSNWQVFAEVTRGSQATVINSNPYLEQGADKQALVIFDGWNGGAMAQMFPWTKTLETRYVVTIVSNADGTVSFACARDATTRYLDATVALQTNSKIVGWDAPVIRDTSKWVLTPTNPVDDTMTTITGAFTSSKDSTTLGVAGDKCWFDNLHDTQYITNFNTALDYFAKDGKCEGKYALKKQDFSGAWSDVSQTNWQKLTLTKDTQANIYKWNNPLIAKQTTAVKQVTATEQIRAYRDITAPTGFSFPTGTHYVGASTSKTFSYPFLPDLELKLIYAPDGLYIKPKSSYLANKAGYIRLLLSTDIVDGTIQQIVTKNEQDVFIPASKLKRFLQEGEQIKFAWTVSTDIFDSGGTKELSSAVEYQGGLIDDMTLVVDTTKRPGALAQATVNRTGYVRLWTVFDGRMYEQTKKQEQSGKTVFEFTYPFNKPFTVLTSWKDATGTQWGIVHKHVDAVDLMAHAFNWDGGAVVLWLNKDDPLEEQIKYANVATTEQFNGRLHPSTIYLTDGQTNVTEVSGEAQGYLVDDMPTPFLTTRSDVKKLVEIGHCIYRTPTGQMFNCAVTDAQTTASAGVTEVSVTWARESLEVEEYE
jgi:hypothetical protein